MSDGYTKLADKPFDSHYMIEEIDIDRPVEHVWPFALNIGGWMNAHGLETVDGRPNKVGHFERVYPKNVSPETPQPHHHVYGVAHVIPNKYVALEVMPEKGGSYGITREYVSFDGILLNDLDGARTRVTFLYIDMHHGKGSAEEYAKKEADIQRARGLLQSYLVQLKQQAEG